MPKERLTITLDNTTLRRLDQLIDGVDIRNRSHAIETILSAELKPTLHTALILGAGEGVNLRPFTYELPKPLIPVQGKPLLDHTLALLKRYGITDITITLGHLGEKIAEQYDDGSKIDCTISYSDEPRLLGTAGGMVRARAHVEDAPFLLMYGDVLVDIDLTAFTEFFLQSKALGAIALTSVSDPSIYGAVKMEGNTVVSFTEKPEAGTRASRLVSTGVFAFRPEIFSLLPAVSPQEPLSLEQDVFPRLIEERALVGYPFSGQWFDITDPHEYERALKEWGGK